MTTLVIGGGGFVGLNIAEHSLSQGHDVRIFDIAAPPPIAIDVLARLPGNLDVVTGDVCDADALSNATRGMTDVVYGAAITASDVRDRDAPERTMAVNLDGFLTALRAAKTSGVRRVLNLSSAGAYGAAAFTGEGPLTEEDPQPDPRNIYSVTKFASERVADRMAEIWEMDVISVRLSGVFGRWERSTGVRDTLSPQFQILAALQSGTPALLERTGNRDWTYAPDVARAVRGLLDADALDHQLFNVSTGVEWSTLAWGETLAKHIPGAVCRLAEPGETPTVALHSPTDRRPMSIERLKTATGFGDCALIEQSVEDLLAWTATVGDAYS